MLRTLTFKVVIIMASILGAQSAAAFNLPAGLDPENTIVMQLKYGPVIIRLLPATAPAHVQRIKELSREHFYDGVIFHRVIDGFMAQTGDPTGTGTGGSDKPDLMAEFSKVPHERGTVSMARTSDPNSANSQFFICFQPQPGLDGKYTVWGQVVSGMEYVDKIARGEPPAHPDKIIWMRVAADIKDKAAPKGSAGGN